MTDDELAGRFGTPLYVYRLEEIDAAVSELRGALPQPSKLLYSVKANPHPDIVAHLTATGCGLELSSLGELEVASLVGAPLERCVYTGPAKTEPEIVAVLKAGIGLMSVESELELRRLEHAARAVGHRCRVVLRVNPKRPARAAGLRMSAAVSQFGIGVEQLVARPFAIDQEAVDPIGTHVFTATNIDDPESLADAAVAAVRTACAVASAGILPLGFVDLGGGFASPYAVTGPRPALGGFASSLEPVLDTELPGWRTSAPSIAFESGRFLVGSSGTLVTSVIDVKRSGGTEFVVLDTGINHIGGMAGLRRLPPFHPELLLADGRDRSETAPVDVVGPLCTPLDRLASRHPLPSARPGDLVSIPNVGAYGLTASLLGFLSRPLPIEVVVRGDELVSATRIQLGRKCP